MDKAIETSESRHISEALKLVDDRLDRAYEEQLEKSRVNLSRPIDKYTERIEDQLMPTPLNKNPDFFKRAALLQAKKHGSFDRSREKTRQREAQKAGYFPAA